MTMHSGVSLSTVLAQALHTNDNSLLESCFHNTDTQIIRSTVQRLDSKLAGVLIQKLAERLSGRPGRYGHLLVWVQWICVAHGGAIGGQPDVLNKIKVLYGVLDQRSKTLDSLLLLKGKLDMLDAQLGLRKQLLSEGGLVRNLDEGPVIYIEGEEEDADSDSDDEEGAVNGDARTTSTTKSGTGKKNPLNMIPADEEDSEDDQDMPMTNGIITEYHISDLDPDSEDEDEDEDAPIQQRAGGLVEDEAEESDEDSHPSDREDDASEEEDVSQEDSGDEDSEMDDFIDDASIAEGDGESGSEISIDQTPEKPPALT